MFFSKYLKHIDIWNVYDVLDIVIFPMKSEWQVKIKDWTITQEVVNGPYRTISTTTYLQTNWQLRTSTMI